jgi:hypothetical protein
MKAEEIKLHFQKLNEQRIELALIDSAEKNIGAIYDDIQRSKVILSQAGNQVESILKNVILKANANIDSLAKGEQMAKELGVDSSKISDLKSRSQKSISTANEVIKNAQYAIKA